jgi:uncharacterized protein (TIGR00369 family)
MNPDDFEPITSEREVFLCSRIPRPPFFPSLVGLTMNEVRRGYARMTLPYRTEVTQPSGSVHGGAIATLIDTVVVGAILSLYDDPTEGSKGLVTVVSSIQYLAYGKGEDLVAEARIRQRRKHLTFVEVEVVTASGSDIAHAEVVYRTSS